MTTYFNYRVIRRVDAQGEEYFGIHEVYYDGESGKPTSVSVNPIAPFGNDLDELNRDLTRMTEAFKKPVLDYQECFGPKDD